MDDLIAFLRTRLDEDEAVARAALHSDAVRPGAWTTEHHNSETHSEPNRCHIAEDRSGNYWSVAHEVFIPNAEHIARWDPARVLAEVEAKREILDEYRLWAEDDSRDYDQSQTAADRTAALDVVVKLLAQPYAEHPDYRPEWLS